MILSGWTPAGYSAAFTTAPRVSLIKKPPPPPKPVDLKKAYRLGVEPCLYNDRPPPVPTFVTLERRAAA